MPLEQRPIAVQHADLETARKIIASAIGRDFRVATWMSGSETLFWAVRRVKGEEGRDPVFVDQLFVEINAAEWGPFPAPDLRAAEVLQTLVEKDVLQCWLSDEKTLAEFWKAKNRFVIFLGQ